MWPLFVGILIFCVAIYLMSPSDETTKKRGFRSTVIWLTTYSIRRQRNKRMKLIDESRRGDYFESEDKR
jgi:hypothetical protein